MRRGRVSPHSTAGWSGAVDCDSHMGLGGGGAMPRGPATLWRVGSVPAANNLSCMRITPLLMLRSAPWVPGPGYGAYDAVGVDALLVQIFAQLFGGRARLLADADLDGHAVGHREVRGLYRTDLVSERVPPARVGRRAGGVSVSMPARKVHSGDRAGRAPCGAEEGLACGRGCDTTREA